MQQLVLVLASWCTLSVLTAGAWCLAATLVRGRSRRDLFLSIPELAESAGPLVPTPRVPAHG